MDRAMVRVTGSVRFAADASQVYVYIARTVLTHALEPEADEDLGREIKVLTRYQTKLGPMTVVTTEEATLEPGKSVTWRHVDGPLTGSVEIFRIETARGGGTVVRYAGEIRARNRWLRGPLESLFIAPLTRMVSVRSLRDAKKSLEGEYRREAGTPLG